MSSDVKTIPRLLTVRQLAEVTGIATWRIHSMCAEGKLPFLRVGKTYRFAEDAVVDWIKEQSNQKVRP